MGVLCRKDATRFEFLRIRDNAMDSVRVSSHEELDWLHQARQGDADAFALLVERYLGRVYNLCLRYLGDAQEAEDITQETFLRAYQHLWNYDPRRPFWVWLRTIAVRLCIDRLRRRRPQVRLDTLPFQGSWFREEAPLPEERMLQAEQQERLYRLVQQLPPVDRALVVLHYWEGLSYQELAETLNLTVSAVKSRLFRARKALWQAWRKQEEEEVP